MTRLEKLEAFYKAFKFYRALTSRELWGAVEADQAWKEVEKAVTALEADHA